MSKRFILIGVVIIGILAFSFYILNNQGTTPCDKLVNKLGNVYRNIFQKSDIPLYMKSENGECYRFDVVDKKISHFNKKIKEWFVIGFIIITIMSLPINILWRFRLKIPAFLFTIMTALAVIAIPYIYGW
ncbi:MULTISPECIES: hypothetical protein [unclassified Bartonella]|uniref:hypothetical protein n=1 Tax=unclassified Bartonella TaxID=2645622 RepID=UPI0035CEE7A4